MFVSSWQNVVLMTRTVAGTITEDVLSICQFITNNKMNFTVEVKMKAEVEDGCGPSKGARSKGVLEGAIGVGP